MNAPLDDFLISKDIVTGLSARSKKQLFRLLAEKFSPELGVSADQIVDVLMEREKLSSTGFGGGIAIPHGKLDELTQVRAFLAILHEPVEYDAIDDLPVDIVVVILSPRDAGTEHLKALAKASRLLRDRELLAKLRGAGSPDAAYALLAAYKGRALA